MSEIRLVDRDYEIFREIDRWRVCLGRHIKELAGFDGQRACDRRLRKLMDAGYLERKRILYGVPGMYVNTYRAKLLASLSTKTEKIRVEQIPHDIAVLDCALFVHQKGIPFSDMTTEKQLHIQDGFGQRKHRPDFIYRRNEKTICVEVELALKAKDRLEANAKANFMDYDIQVWIVPNHDSKIARILEANKTAYQNIKIFSLQEVRITG